MMLAMSDALDLGLVFVSALEARLGHSCRSDMSTSALEQHLVQLLSSSRDAFPSVHLAPEVFVRYVADRVAANLPLLSTAMRALRGIDLYLACACAHGDEEALAIFDERYFGEVDTWLSRMDLPESVCDEVKQVLRLRFFVVGAGIAPRIVDYAGRGDLRSWVRAAAVRAALRVIRKPKGLVAIDASALKAVAAPSEDIELDYLKRKHGADFEMALCEAFALLPVQERNVIRHYFGSGLGIDELGALYNVHRATAARWVNRAGASLAETTREILMRRLRVGRGEISSILRLFHSQLETTLFVVARNEMSTHA
jgi:RNA polymerase sigma-70 factor, ECF subfamily